MSNTMMNAYHIRLELLKMSKDMLTEDYYGKREIVNNSWQTDLESARLKGSDLPKHPGFPAYPTEDEVIKKATQLNHFVSQPTIPSAIENKISKKST